MNPAAPAGGEGSVDTTPPILAPLREAMSSFAEAPVRKALATMAGGDGGKVAAHYCWPFGDLNGADDIYEQVYAPLLSAWPDLERRDWLVMSGDTDAGNHWIGCGGFYCGTFVGPWLDIPPTGHLAHMRYHEFYRVENGRVAEIQAIWDIPEVMMQAGAWPLPPSLGREWAVPAPATQDGLHRPEASKDETRASLRHVIDMLKAMGRHPDEPPEAMALPRFWHPRMNWYGPAGIGTGRGIEGFRNWHQIPFLAAMPDRGKRNHLLTRHFFAEGPYVGVTAWPGMRQTLGHGGWLGIAPAGRLIDMRSLDFWRLEGGLIRENWVLIDLLDVLRQLDIDVFARLREFNKARNMGRIPLVQGWQG